MGAYDPERDVLADVLAEFRPSEREKLRVAIRRYDAEDGTEGEEKLEFSRWRVAKDGTEKAQKGFRFTREELVFLISVLLDVDRDSVSVDEEWMGRIADYEPAPED